jgi:hypothetical protein
MGLAFLETAFLAGIAAAAIPIVIHLMHRRKSRTLRFPSIRFLREIDARTARRSRLRERLILAMRVLALAVLALALARPVLRESGAFGRGRASRVLVIDNSMSMEARVDGASALERSRLGALEFLRGTDPADRTAVLALHEPEGAAPALTEDRRGVEEALRAIRPTPFATPLPAALGRAYKLLEDDSNPVKEVLVFSDLQATAFPGGAPVPPAPPRTRTILLAPRRSPAPNLAVSGAAALPSGGRKVPLQVKVRNFGVSEAVAALTVRIDGKSVEERSVRVPAGAEATVSAGPYELPPGLHGGTIAIGEDPLLPDNVRAFSVDVPEAVRVLVARDPARSASSDPAFYIAQALRAGVAQGGIRAKLIATEALDGEDLAAFDVAVLAEPARIGTRGTAALGEFLRAGGGILFVAGPGQSPDEFRPLAALPGAPGGGGPPPILPAALVAVAGARAEPFHLRDWPPSHPLWEPLLAASPPLQPGLARFTSYWKVEPSPGAAVLARFDSGDPAIVEAEIGGGRTILVASALRPVWNNLPLKFTFVPLVHAAVRYLAGGSRQEVRRLAGAPLSLAYRAGAVPSEVVLRPPEGAPRTLRPKPGPDGSAAADFGPLGAPGLSILEEKGARPVRRAVIVAPDPSESALDPLTAERIAEVLPGARAIEFATPGDAARGAIEASLGSELKNPLLFVLLALILIEPVLANRVAFRRAEEALARSTNR